MNNTFETQLQVKTKNDSSALGKRRVFFYSHSQNFIEEFDKIAKKIWNICDCAIYYLNDSTNELYFHNLELNLSQMNLFVISVSSKLLDENSTVLDFLFSTAKKYHIPILPIIVEQDVEEKYSKSIFKKMQYISFNKDKYGYELFFDQKLDTYVSSILTDDETAKRVRNAFNAYIFLSYRKKDRIYADKLMRIIHKNPFLRDVAIWYDEYLVPGEDFNENIKNAISKSDLFTLLITPNLINEDNYIIRIEYPEIKKTGKNIIAAEAIKTERKELEQKYEGIPECVDIESEQLYKLLLQALEHTAQQSKISSPEHLFLIGLAYFDGIDVEVDKEKGVELIGEAAIAGLDEAKEKFRSICMKEANQSLLQNGVELEQLLFDLISEVDFVFNESNEWRQSYLNYQVLLYEYSKKILGSKDSLFFEMLGALILKEYVSRENTEVLHRDELISLCKEIYEEKLIVPEVLEKLADCYDEVDCLDESLLAAELYELLFSMSCSVHGEDNNKTLYYLTKAADIYGVCNSFNKQAPLVEKKMFIYCKCYGLTDKKTENILLSLIEIYKKVYDPITIIEKFDKLYANIALLQNNSIK